MELIWSLGGLNLALLTNSIGHKCERWEIKISHSLVKL